MITAIRFNGVGISAFGSLITGGTSAFARNSVGFVHALERRLKDRQCTLGRNRRVAVGVENYVLHKGEKNHSSAKMALSRPWKGQSNYAASVLDYEWKCNATVTLLIHSDGVEDTQELQKALRSEIPKMRFANGSIFLVHDHESFVNVHAGNDGETLKQAIRSVKASRSSFLICREDLVASGDEFNSFADALALFDADADAVAQKAEEVADSSTDSSLATAESSNESGQGDVDDEQDKKRRNWMRKEKRWGWIVPIERGYIAVTKPIRNRPGIRNPHVDSYVVTPVVSLGEFISSKRLLGDLNVKVFWSSKSDRNVGSFLFLSTSFN